MASFAEYQNPISVTDSNDFVLYSTHDSYPDFMPTSHPYNPYLNSTGAGFEPFPVPFTAASQPHDFGFAATAASQHVKAGYPHTPAESPTNSANNSFDIQPPNLSCTSDSGASVQSTSSSAMGSPSLNASYAQEPWSTVGAGLGIAPGIAHPGQEPFGTSGYEYDPVLVNEKIPGCVGESQSISSPQRSMQPTASSAFPSSLAFSSSQNQSQSYSSNVFSSEQRPFQRATSVDTCIGGHQSPRSASSLQTPTSANPYPSRNPQPALQRAHTSGLFTAPGTSEFRSPTTPASATRLHTFFSPRMERRARLPSIPALQDNRTRSKSSPVTGSPQGFSTSTSSQDISSSQALPTSFFNQSSGNFVEPLESSCWFPCPSLFVSSLFLLFVFVAAERKRNSC